MQYEVLIQLPCYIYTIDWRSHQHCDWTYVSLDNLKQTLIEWDIFLPLGICTYIRVYIGPKLLKIIFSKYWGWFSLVGKLGQSPMSPEILA